MKLIFDEQQRREIIYGNEGLQYRIAKMKLCREIMRNPIGKLIIWITEKLKNILN